MVILAVLVFTNSCNESAIQAPIQDNETPQPLPFPDTLSDNIQYAELGSGKIVFERSGSIGNDKYLGIYVIDVNNKTNWGFSSKRLSGVQISPDGDKIISSVYSVFYYLELTDIYGKVINKLSRNAAHLISPSWLPDNRRFVYYETYYNPWNGDKGSALNIYDNAINTVYKMIDFYTIDSNNFQPIPGRNDELISVSKDGYCIFTEGWYGIYCFDINEKYYYPLIKPPFNYDYYNPVWNPSGDKIALLSSPDIDETSILLFKANGFYLTNIYSMQRQYGIYNLCWSPDGSKILFSMNDGKDYYDSIYHIYLINADGTNLVKVTSLPGVQDVSVSWAK